MKIVFLLSALLTVLGVGSLFLAPSSASAMKTGPRLVFSVDGLPLSSTEYVVFVGRTQYAVGDALLVAPEFTIHSATDENGSDRFEKALPPSLGTVIWVQAAQRVDGAWYFVDSEPGVVIS